MLRTSENDLDLLIVGAGPAGLALANCLTDVDLSFQLIDRSAAAGETSRATGIQPRLIPLFEKLEVLDQVRAGATDLLGNMIYRDGALCYSVSFFDPATRSVGISIEQSSLEKILIDRLEAHRVQVRRPYKLSAVDLSAHGIECRLLAPDQTPENISAKLVAACDGGRSTVRHQFNIPFPGRTYDERCFICECRIECDLDHRYMHYFVGSDSRIVLVPLKGEGRYKVSGAVPPGLSRHDPRIIIDALLGEHHGSRYTLHTVSDFSFYQMHARQAETFYRDGAFLCGDAAHLLPPNGGQGLNTAIEDGAFLADILREFSVGRDEKILTRYREREIAAAQRLAETTAQKDRMSYEALQLERAG